MFKNMMHAWEYDEYLLSGQKKPTDNLEHTFKVKRMPSEVCTFHTYLPSYLHSTYLPTLKSVWSIHNVVNTGYRSPQCDKGTLTITACGVVKLGPWWCGVVMATLTHLVKQSQ